MGITIATYSRELNPLEAQAVDLALSELVAGSTPITITIGQDNSQEFVALSRGRNEVMIHFGPEHKIDRGSTAAAERRESGSGSSASSTKKPSKVKGRPR